jgi:hypothetical protein
MGHTVVPPHAVPFQGDAHTIWVKKPNDYIGVADRRRSDQSSAAGYGRLSGLCAALFLVELQRQPELGDGPVALLDGLFAVAAEVVVSPLQILLGFLQSDYGAVNGRVSLVAFVMGRLGASGWSAGGGVLSVGEAQAGEQRAGQGSGGQKNSQIFLHIIGVYFSDKTYF